MYLIKIGNAYLSETGVTKYPINARTFAFKWLAEIVAKKAGGTVIEFTDET